MQKLENETLKDYVKRMKAEGPGRYTFDSTTGVCLNVEDWSLVYRFPLGCDAPGYGCDHSPLYDKSHREAGFWQGIPPEEYACYQEHKRAARWRAYLRKELGL